MKFRVILEFRLIEFIYTFARPFQANNYFEQLTQLKTMCNTSKLLALFLFVFLSFNISAQSMASTDKVKMDFITLDATDSEWSFYSDDENKTYYIDFEKLSFNLSEIVVKDAEGSILIREEVLDLPVNTIFELDFRNFESGKYLIELRSFKGMVKKEITLE